MYLISLVFFYRAVETDCWFPTRKRGNKTNNNNVVSNSAQDTERREREKEIHTEE